MELRVVGEHIDLEEAYAVVRGYAFAMRPVAWSRPRDGVGEPLDDRTVPVWAYRTYDCVPRGEGQRLSALDMLVADGINGRLSGATVAAIQSVSDLVSDALERVPASPFWELPIEHVVVPPPEDEPSWWMWRAWTLLMGARHCDLAVTHKTLHHKRPDLFPLIDNKTRPELGTHAWRQIHHDLTATPEGWAELEVRFEAEAEAAKPKGVRLTRLRMHDILLWTRVTGDRQACIDEARHLVTGI